jgi:hypothetical protein
MNCVINTFLASDASCSLRVWYFFFLPKKVTTMMLIICLQVLEFEQKQHDISHDAISTNLNLQWCT